MNISSFNISTLFSILFIMISVSSFSQENSNDLCGTIIDQEKVDFFNSFNSQIKKYETTFLSKSSKSGKSSIKALTNSIPVKAHIIRSSQGTGGLSLFDLNNIINNLNTIYADAYLEFYLSEGINYVDNNTFCHLNKQDESDLTNGNNVSNVINIYFTDYLENASNSSICGYANTVGMSDIIVIRNDCAKNGSSLAHEIGHLFSLMHTHGPDGNKNTTELVDGSNCDTDGDGICDTPADPKLSSKKIKKEDCSYNGTAIDANGHSYNPDTGNIMSYSIKKCRSHFSKQQLARMFGFYKSVKKHYSSNSFNADFSVDIDQTCDNSLTVNFTGTCENITQWEWDVDGDHIIDYTTKTPSHTFDQGVYNVSLTVSNKSQSISKTYFNYIKVGTLKNTPFSEGFESFTTAGDHGWTANNNYENGYNWLINSGETQTKGTGPLVDYNDETSSGAYIYAEASGAIQGDIAEFTSPCIEINKSNLELEFAYHMFGENMGQLHVDIQTDNGYQNDVIPAIKGQVQKSSDEDFLTKTIDLSKYNGQTIKIRFRAVRGNGWDSDIAIDNISIKEKFSKTKQLKALNVKVYPNPISGNMLYLKSTDLEGSTYYTISNLTGQVFVQGTLNNNEINLNRLNKGVYLLTLQNGSSTIVKKVIK